MISSSQRPLPDNTQHLQQTNTHAPGGIQTHDLSRRAATDLRLRPRGHWDRQNEIILYQIIFQLFKQINQQDATVSQVHYLTFMCVSTCFGRLSAHYQERTNALGASGFTVGAWELERCWSWSHDQQLSNHHAPTVKPEAPSAVVGT